MNDPTLVPIDEMTDAGAAGVFARSFVQSPAAGDLSFDPATERALAGWFEIAIDAGRRAAQAGMLADQVAGAPGRFVMLDDPNGNPVAVDRVGVDAVVSVDPVVAEIYDEPVCTVFVSGQHAVVRGTVADVIEAIGR